MVNPFKETLKLEKSNLLTQNQENQVEAPTPDITETISINQLLETSNVTHRNIMYHRSDHMARQVSKSKPTPSFQKPTQNFKETVVNTAPYLEYLEYKKQVHGHEKVKSPPGPRLKTYQTQNSVKSKTRKDGKSSNGSGSAKSEASTHNPNLRSISINSILGRSYLLMQHTLCSLHNTGIILKFFRPRTAQVSRTPAKRNGNTHRPEREFYQSQGSKFATSMFS